MTPTVIPISASRAADPTLDAVWSNQPDGRGMMLATDAGRAALGGAPDSASTAAVQAGQVVAARGGRRRDGGQGGRAGGRGAQASRQYQAGGLDRHAAARKGATIAEVFDWQPRTVRGALARALKQRLGLAIDSERVEGGAASTESTVDRRRPSP